MNALTAMKNMPISFPGLFGDWELNIDPVAIHIGHGIYWYGIILAFAMLAGLYLCMKQAKHYGLTEDNVMDMVLWAVPCCIIGSRIYYVLFYLDLYRKADGSLDWGAMLRIWDGGLAIYGTVIVGVLVALIYTKRHKIPFFAMTDLAVMGLMLGQIIGRWANFINREAFGAATEGFTRMGLYNTVTGVTEYYHPTFLYESGWNLIGFVILHFLSKKKKYDGEIALGYCAWYGLGRTMIEGLRMDSLYWGPFRVSQVLAAVSCIAATAVLLVQHFRPHDPAKLAVNRLAAAEKAKAEAAAAPELQAASETDYFKDINNVYSLLAVEPIEMEFGYSLIPLVDEKSGGKLISRIVIFRRQYAQDMGFVIPSIRLHDGAALGTNQYVIKIRGEEVARGEILVDYYLALEPSNPTGEIDGIETVEPAYGIPSRWILPENKEMAEIYGYTVITPLTVMLTHLSETIKKHTYELLNRSETIQLVEHLKQTEPELVADAIPNVVSYANLEKILKSLLREGIPIKDLATILEAVVEASGGTRDIDMITEQVRSALSRTITRRFCENGQLRVVTLDAEVEKKVLAALTKNDHGVYLALSPDIMQQIIAQLGELRKKFNDLSQTPIVLTSQIIRVYLSRMIAQFYPDVYVLSFHEITSSVQIQAIGNITLQQQNQPS